MMDDTSICLSRAVCLPVEVDPVVRLGSMRHHESTGDDMGMSEHTVMSDSSQRHAKMYGGIKRGIVSLQGGDTPRGACRCHSFAAAPSYERSLSPF
jgi:hypothetical protein